MHAVLAAARGTDDRRPGIKGILLSGSPGVGKTTLAHVAARHCGYRVVEINASDERSRGALLNAVNSAVQVWQCPSLYWYCSSTSTALLTQVLYCA